MLSVFIRTVSNKDIDRVKVLKIGTPDLNVQVPNFILLINMMTNMQNYKLFHRAIISVG